MSQTRVRDWAGLELRRGEVLLQMLCSMRQNFLARLVPALGG
jgi:hypothetical protein